MRNLAFVILFVVCSATGVFAQQSDEIVIPPEEQVEMAIMSCQAFFAVEDGTRERCRAQAEGFGVTSCFSYQVETAENNTDLVCATALLEIEGSGLPEDHRLVQAYWLTMRRIARGRAN